MRGITHRQWIADWVLLAALAVFVGVPFAGALWSHANGVVSLTEKRKLTDLPPWPRTLAAWQHYPKAFDAFATDRFGFRDEVLDVYKWLLTSVFGQPAASKTIVGKHGWLFLGDKSALEDMSGTGQFSRERLTGLVEQINAHGALLAVRQIRYGFVVFPDKYTVYPQFLPAGLYAGRGRRRLHDLNVEMVRSGHDYYFDASDALVRHAQGSPFRLYYPTDTHWNYWGAYLGYQAWARAEGARLGLRPQDYPFEQFKLQAMGGDLYIAGGFKSRGFKVYPPTGAGCQYFKPWQPAPDVLLHTRTEPDHLHVSRCDGSGDALVVHDSYLFSMEPYLGSNFRTSRYVWNDLDADDFGWLVRKLNPDTVLMERVERVLLLMPPTDLPALVRSLGIIGAPVVVDGSGHLVIDVPQRRSVRTGTAGRLAIDSVKPGGGGVRVVGWAAMGDRPPAAVLAVADGHVVGEAPVVLPRPDVAAGTREPLLAWSGYELDLPARLAAGPGAGVELYLVDFDHYAAVPATAWPACKVAACTSKPGAPPVR